MYYVLQVASGMEARTEELIVNILPKSLYGECFHPTRHMRKKFHGCFRDIHERLLPGYVFITTDDAKRMFLELKRVPALTKLLGRDGGYFSGLSERDVEWLGRMIGRQTGACRYPYEVGLSQVSVGEGNEVRIVSGPLKDMEGLVRKINLHKRVAEVEVSFMRQRMAVYLGIELLSVQDGMERQGKQ